MYPQITHFQIVFMKPKKENEKNFIRDWNEHKIQSLTRENTKIKPKPIQHFDQADISHLASKIFSTVMCLLVGHCLGINYRKNVPIIGCGISTYNLYEWT